MALRPVDAFESSALVRCEAPVLAAGTQAAVEAVVGGGLAVVLASIAGVEVVAVPAVDRVEPESGYTFGGAVVSVHIASLPESYDNKCGFGTVRSVYGRWVSTVLVECVAPAHAAGVVPVEVSWNGGAEYTAALISYTYTEESAIVVEMVVPSDDGSSVTVRGAQVGGGLVTLCAIGEATVAGVPDGADSLLCGVPPGQQGFSAVGVMVDGEETVRWGQDVVYEYLSHIHI